MCHGTFDTEFGDRRLEVPSDHGIVPRPFFFRQRYNTHSYALDRTYRRSHRLLLSRVSSSINVLFQGGHAMSDSVPDGDQQQSLQTEMKERAELISPYDCP